MQSNYLQNNILKYVDHSDVMLFNGKDVTTSDTEYISYTNNEFNTLNTPAKIIGATFYYDDISTHTLIASRNINTSNAKLIYCYCLPMQCDDFIEVLSSDTITFTITLGDQSFVKSFQLLPQCINMFNLFGVITLTSPVKSFTISATVNTHAHMRLFKYTDNIHSLMFMIVTL